MRIDIFASGSKANCYHVSDGHTRLLLDCGLPITEIKSALNFDLSGVSGCLLSHTHL